LWSAENEERKKYPTLVLVAEEGGKGNECSPWAFSEGVRETKGAGKARRGSDSSG